MELTLALPMHLNQGLAIIALPEVLKRDPFKSTIRVDSLYLPSNLEAKSEGCFLVCNASFYRDKNQQLRKNILGLFMNVPTATMTTFGDFSATLTMPQETVQIECVDFHGKRQNITACGVVHIRGSVSNKLLAI